MRWVIQLPRYFLGEFPGSSIGWGDVGRIWGLLEFKRLRLGVRRSRQFKVTEECIEEKKTAWETSEIYRRFHSSPQLNVAQCWYAIKLSKTGKRIIHQKKKKKRNSSQSSYDLHILTSQGIALINPVALGKVLQRALSLIVKQK